VQHHADTATKYKPERPVVRVILAKGSEKFLNPKNICTLWIFFMAVEALSTFARLSISNNKNIFDLRKKTVYE